MNLSENYAQA